jgi:hypothetical protein
MSKMTILGVISLSALVAAGCGSGPKLIPVNGTVTINGKPLEGAVIQFVPDSTNTTGQLAEDVTGPTGNYKAMTKRRSGVIPGKYRVVISKAPPVANSALKEQFKGDPFMAQLSAVGPDQEKAQAKNKDAVAKLEQTFEQDVSAEGGTLDFDVKANAATEKTVIQNSSK